MPRTAAPDDDVFSSYVDGVSAVVRIAQRFGPADWLRRTPCELWLARDIAGHLVATAIDAHEGLKKAIKNEPTYLMTETELARYNDEQLAALPDRLPGEHIQEFRGSAGDYLREAKEHLTLRSYRWGERHWTVRHNIGVLAIEWHVHAWDLAMSIGAEHTPRHPATLAQAFRCGMAYMSLGAGESWHDVLRAAGRDPERPFRSVA